MQVLRLALLFAALNAVAPASAPLRILRVTPTTPADPLSDIVVTFDRPVAGGLDGIIDPARIFRLAPAVTGKLEWRDPVSIRFTPAAPLQTGAEYTVTIAGDFQAMDGSQLLEPFTFSFRVSPAAIVAGDPVGINLIPKFLPPNPTFRLLLSAPGDPRFLAERGFITLGPQCGNANIGLTLLRIRRVTAQDPGQIRFGGRRGYVAARADSARDLRRVVELQPSRPLPLNCSAVLTLPQEIDAATKFYNWPFSTFGPLQVRVAECARTKFCPTGPIRLTFSTPVRGSEVLRRVRIAPTIEYAVADTTAESDEWFLEANLKPREHYAVVVDSLLADVFGQRLPAVSVKAFTTTSYEPGIVAGAGKLLVERDGFRTIAIQAVNADTVEVTTIPIPAAREMDFLAGSWNLEEPLKLVANLATRRLVGFKTELDKPYIAGVQFPANDARVTHNGTLIAARITRPGDTEQQKQAAGVLLIQVTDLGVHGRIGLDQGMVWVTGVRDGRPRANVLVTLYDPAGKVRTTARTDAQGLARLSNFAAPTQRDCTEWCGSLEGYVSATLNDDRALIGLASWDPDLAAWNFGIRSAWSDDARAPAAGALFTDRGIYRPGEKLYAKAIVRRGALGSLLPPPRGDSLKWVFKDRDDGVLQEITTTLSGYGTADQSLTLPAELPLGLYQVHVQLKRDAAWLNAASTSYQVAEYRPPEFLVEVNADPAPRFAGDTLSASVSARYLFGAPMASAPVRWVIQQRTLSPWDLDIPNTEGWQLGEQGSLDGWYGGESGVNVAREGVDTLDARGALNLKVALPPPPNGRGARTGIIAVVTDANRQTVSAGRSVIVHPASFYIAAKVQGSDYFWRAGQPVTIDLIAVHPTGERVAGVNIQGAIIRREWHSARRTRNGSVEDVGGWVTDTVAACNATTASDPVNCRFTPAEGGSYLVALTARDQRGRIARTGFWRWASGAGWVPWRDDTKLRMDLIADRQEYSVGDTATVLIASPFTDVEAWITIERERVIESRRMRLTAGATTIRVPITEALAPNAFVSVILVRGRSAPPKDNDDPGRPTIRVGYVELRVVPAVKRLRVELTPAQPEYRPGDTARVRVAVTDAAGRGQASEVTLWAVDEGVLALTDYQTPDPVGIIYNPRGLGVRLASNLVAVAAQVPPGLKGQRAPGGGGGNDISAILRSRFQTTAFFLGSVVTDANGNATAAARLPDNLTTFRVMAVAVTAGDRYGSGASSMLVTRPLVARPSLPRFVREGDRFAAGVVVNQRAGGTRAVQVNATVRGITLQGSRQKSATLSGPAGREVRFDFVAQAGDSAHFQFAAESGADADAVALRVPVRPSYHPLAQTIAGALRDTATAEFSFDTEIDPARSQLEISLGSSTLAVIRGARRSLRVYPYYCTEQVASTALPLIALYRAQKELGVQTGLSATAEQDIQTAVNTIVRRQSTDGGIGYWGSLDWSTPWLTSYATRVLLEARAAGFKVDDAVLTRIAGFVARSLRETTRPRFAVAYWYDNINVLLSERVAAVDLLSRLGRPDVPMENSLFGQAAQLRWEDRVLLAEVMARRGAIQPARSLLASAWQSVQPQGRTVAMPVVALNEHHYFKSEARPAARLLTATLAVEPTHPLLGALAETLVQRGRAQAADIWNTQDYGATVLALTSYERARTANAQGTLQIRAGNRTLLSQNLATAASRDTTLALTGLVGNQRVRLSVTATNTAAPVYYFITVREVPRARPVRPVDHGIAVERWYERVDSRTPITSIAAGELVRVRVRITVPNERHMVVVDDPLPAGLEAVDLSLRTVSPFGQWDTPADLRDNQPQQDEANWFFGSWDSGAWSPFDYKELRDDRVIYFATVLWKGTYTASYLARATTAGTFVSPPAHAEEMYNPAVNGRTGGGTFTVRPQ